VGEIDQIENFGVAVVYLALGTVMWLVGRREGRGYLYLWMGALFCFAAHSLINAFLFLFDLPEHLHGLAWGGLIAGCVFVIAGVQSFIRFRIPFAWLIVGATLLAAAGFAFAAGAPIPWIRFVVFAFIGATLVAAGIAFYRAGPPGAGRVASGLGCAAAGVYGVVYPMIRHLPWVPAAEFFIDLTFVLWVSMGVVLMHFELARDEARRLAARYRSLFEGALVGLFRLDRAGRFLAANPTLLEILQCDEARALRLNLVEDVLTDDVVRAETRRSLDHGRSLSLCEAQWRRPDGTAVHVLMAIRAVPDDDGDIFEGSAHDVSAEHRLRSQLQQAERLDSLGRLAGGVAHDFNNILAVIVNGTELGLRRARNHPEVEQPLETVLEAARAAADLTRQLLTFGQRHASVGEAVDLNERVRGSVRMLRAVLDPTIELRTELSDQPLPIIAPPGQLEQVLMNLALNARDAMPDGGSITIRTTLVADHDRGRRARLSVHDAGHGMDETTRARALEPFFTTKQEGRGTGLGLATVYGIVQGLRGTIEIESAVTVGTTFTIELPLTVAAQPAKPESDVPIDGASAAPSPPGAPGHR
jgi:PAS domain S-box-containing protein